MTDRKIERRVNNYRAYLQAGMPPINSLQFIMNAIERMTDLDDLKTLHELVEVRCDTIKNQTKPIQSQPPSNSSNGNGSRVNYQQLLGLPYPLSRYQSDVIDWVLYGTGNAICSAVAGSGKSTTLVYATMALRFLKQYEPDEIKLIVFGKANSLDLNTKLVDKLGQAWNSCTKTLHSLGFAMLKEELGEFAQRGDRNPPHGIGRIDNYKYHKIAKQLGYANATRQGREKGSLVIDGMIDKPRTFIKLIDFCRFQLVDSFLEPESQAVEQLSQLINHFADQFDGVCKDDESLEIIGEAIGLCLEAGINQAANEKVIDFADQIWLPVRWQLNQRPWFNKFLFKFLFVDECQDLNPCQRELSLMLLGETGRALYVGDASQSIMGFAGADCDSFNLIQEHAKCQKLPLSVCYRCPQSHIRFVRSEFPNIAIEPFEDAPEGEMKVIKECDLWDNGIPQHLQDGDLVLCRKTAPLVVLCLKLISKGIAATVKGRDIGSSLISELEKVGKLMESSYGLFREFPEYLDKYHRQKLESMKHLDNYEQLAESLQDKVSALNIIYERYQHVKGCDELAIAIEGLFTDNGSPITLSTAHRAKGLEADRVFIVQPDSLPLVWKNQSDWQSEQEENLRYVALTRAKKELYIVQSDKPCDWMKRIPSA